MGIFQKLFKHTFIYGLATVLPRMLSFILVPLYTAILPTGTYGEVSIVFSYFVICNVLLAYGMETAFFRFFTKEPDKDTMVGTATLSLLISSTVFFLAAYFFKNQIANITEIKGSYIQLIIWILLLDALVIIPFAWLRANEKPKTYAIIKILNVAINLGLNVFLLVYLTRLSATPGVWDYLCKDNYEINYIFISNLIASSVTLLCVLSFYRKVKFRFDAALWKKMIRYAFPVLIAGVAYSINESFDKILLGWLLPENQAKHLVGVYAACYKLALFMTLFATAFRLGIEPFFFSHAENKNATQTYATITKYFVILGSLILLFVVVFIDLLKIYIVTDESYWEALVIVPIILIANFCLGIYHNLSVWYKITDRTKYGAYISVGGAILTIIINVIFIKYYGYIASAFATLIAYGMMMVASWYLGRKHYPIPYDMKKIGMYFLLSVGFSIISFYIFDRDYRISIPLLLVFLVVLYVTEHREIRRILKK